MATKNPRTFRNVEELADAIGALEPTEKSMDHRVYKDTACGAWLTLLTDEATGTVVGVQLGSIVEGSSVEIGPYDLLFPIAEQDYDDCIQVIEDQAEAAWNEANEHE